MVGEMKTLTAQVANEIKQELENIPEKYYKDFNSTHEGLAVILEEFEELKLEVFFGEKRVSGNQNVHKERMRREAIQTAAMCVRFIQELT
jgi:hypothetical protein